VTAPPGEPGGAGTAAQGKATAGDAERVRTTVLAALADAGVSATEPEPGTFLFDLPGERKLATPCRLVVGAHSLTVSAFVCRNPAENHERVYRWLLGRNLRMYGVAFALDASGDIYLTGRLSLDAVSPAELDSLLGSVLTYADESFNTLLELGFATSIRREWAWRISRGESTRNLEAFRGWLESRNHQ
jgi:Putative bacterial sensory transduction regulator